MHNPIYRLHPHAQLPSAVTERAIYLLSRVNAPRPTTLNSSSAEHIITEADSERGDKNRFNVDTNRSQTLLHKHQV